MTRSEFLVFLHKPTSVSSVLSNKTVKPGGCSLTIFFLNQIHYKTQQFWFQIPPVNIHILPLSLLQIRSSSWQVHCHSWPSAYGDNINMVVHPAEFISHSSSSCWQSAQSTLSSLYLPALLCTYVVCSAQGTVCTPFSSEQLLLSLQSCVQQTSLLPCGQPAQCIPSRE